MTPRDEESGDGKEAHPMGAPAAAATVGTSASATASAKAGSRTQPPAVSTVAGASAVTTGTAEICQHVATAIDAAMSSVLGSLAPQGGAKAISAPWAASSSDAGTRTASDVAGRAEIGPPPTRGYVEKESGAQKRKRKKAEAAPFEAATAAAAGFEADSTPADTPRSTMSESESSVARRLPRRAANTGTWPSGAADADIPDLVEKAVDAFCGDPRLRIPGHMREYLTPDQFSQADRAVALEVEEAIRTLAAESRMKRSTSGNRS